MVNDYKKEEIEDIAKSIVTSAEATIIMNLKFLQCAIVNMPWKAAFGTAIIAANGKSVSYDPALLIRIYKQSPAKVVRTYLHVLFHFVFHHYYEYEKKREELWDIACDIAVENVIMEINLYQATLKDDAEREMKLKVLKERAGGLHASALYRLFLVEEPSIREMEDLVKLFRRDEHSFWLPEETLEISLEQWKKISERIKADLKSFSKGSTDSESLKAALNDATRERVDYSDFLRRFMTMGEQLHISDDEFDYVYYTYGLRKYGNMPLIEPLEYSDVKKIKEFVVAIDTSASCKGELVKNFLKKTVEIMSDSENFFHKYNIHVLQCDSKVTSDVCITGKEDLSDYIQNVELIGFGSTDFRPVFNYVDELKRNGEMQDLKGLIYFTDGYGVYPEKMPEYDTAFVFLADDGNAPAVPAWAIRIVLDEEEILK